MQATFFEPQYSRKGLSGIAIISIPFLIFPAFAILQHDFGLLEVVFLIAFVWFWQGWLRTLIRQLVLTPEGIEVERLFALPFTVTYAEIIDIGITKISTRKGYIHFDLMDNSVQFLEWFNSLVEQGKISAEQLAGKLASQEEIRQRSVFPAMGISLPIWAAVLVFWPFYQSWFSKPGVALILLVVVGVVYYGVQMVLHRRLTQRAADGGDAANANR
jgi:hypothetical protein